MAFEWAGEVRLARGRRSEIEYWAAQAGSTLIAVGDAVEVRRIDSKGGVPGPDGAVAASVRTQSSEGSTRPTSFALIESLVQRGEVMAAKVRWLPTIDEALGILAVQAHSAVRGGLLLPKSQQESASAYSASLGKKVSGEAADFVRAVLEAEQSLVDLEGKATDEATRILALPAKDQKAGAEKNGSAEKQRSRTSVVLSYERDCIPLSTVVGPVKLAVVTPAAKLNTHGSKATASSSEDSESKMPHLAGAAAVGFYTGPQGTVVLPRRHRRALVPLQALLAEDVPQEYRSEAPSPDESEPPVVPPSLPELPSVGCAGTIEPRLLSVRPIPEEDAARIMASSDHTHLRAAAALTQAVAGRQSDVLAVPLPPVTDSVKGWASQAEGLLRVPGLREHVEPMLRDLLEDSSGDDSGGEDQEDGSDGPVNEGQEDGSDGPAKEGKEDSSDGPANESKEDGSAKEGKEGEAEMPSGQAEMEDGEGQPEPGDAESASSASSAPSAPSAPMASDDQVGPAAADPGTAAITQAPAPAPAPAGSAADTSQQLRMRAAGEDEDKYRRTRVGREYQATWLPDPAVPASLRPPGADPRPHPERGGVPLDPQEDEGEGPAPRPWSQGELDLFAVLVTQYGKEFHRVAALLGRPTTDVVHLFYARKRWRQQRLGPVDQAAREATELAARARAEAETARIEADAEAAAGEVHVGPGRRRSARAATRAARAQGAAAVAMQSLSSKVPGAWFVGRGQALCSLCLDVFETGALLWCSVSACRRSVCGRCFRVDVETYRTRRSHVRFELARMQPFWTCLDCCPPPLQMQGGAHNGSESFRFHAEAGRALRMRGVLAGRGGGKSRGRGRGKAGSRRALQASQELMEEDGHEGHSRGSSALMAALASVVPAPPEGAADPVADEQEDEEGSGGPGQEDEDPQQELEVELDGLSPEQAKEQLRRGLASTGVFVEEGCAPPGSGTGLLLPACAGGEPWPIPAGLPAANGTDAATHDGPGLAAPPPRVGDGRNSAREQEFWRRVARQAMGTKAGTYPAMPPAVRVAVDPVDTLEKASRSTGSKGVQERAALLRGTVGEWGALGELRKVTETDAGVIAFSRPVRGAEGPAADPFAVALAGGKSAGSGQKQASSRASSGAGSTQHTYPRARSGASGRTGAGAPSGKASSSGGKDRLGPAVPPAGEDPERYRTAVLKAADRQAEAVVAQALALAPTAEEPAPVLGPLGRASGAAGQQGKQADAKGQSHHHHHHHHHPPHPRRPTRAEARMARLQQESAEQTQLTPRDAVTFWRALRQTFGEASPQARGVEGAARRLNHLIAEGAGPQAVDGAQQALWQTAAAALSPRPALAAALLPFVEPHDRALFVAELQRRVLGEEGRPPSEGRPGESMGGSLARDGPAVDAAAGLGRHLRAVQQERRGRGEAPSSGARS